MAAKTRIAYLKKNGERAGDLPLEEAVELAKRLHLSPGRHPELGSRAW